MTMTQQTLGLVHKGFNGSDLLERMCQNDCNFKLMGYNKRLTLERGQTQRAWLTRSIFMKLGDDWIISIWQGFCGNVLYMNIISIYSSKLASVLHPNRTNLPSRSISHSLAGWLERRPVQLKLLHRALIDVYVDAPSVSHGFLFTLSLFFMPLL